MYNRETITKVKNKCFIWHVANSLMREPKQTLYAISHVYNVFRDVKKSHRGIFEFFKQRVFRHLLKTLLSFLFKDEIFQTPGKSYPKLIDKVF